MPDIRSITTVDPLYALECELRERVLLRPIGYTLERYVAEYPEVEKAASHYVAMAQTPGGPRVFGCGLLIVEPQRRGRVVQVAVDPQRQSEGLGRAIMTTIEGDAFGTLGLSELYCHAQVTAIGFYDRLGWQTCSEDFLEAGIVHRGMKLTAPERPITQPPVPGW
ncbi:MAG: GNAT family N-acetyltransferase [Planctomycetota bacterium]